MAFYIGHRLIQGVNICWGFAQAEVVSSATIGHSGKRLPNCLSTFSFSDFRQYIL